MKRAFDILAASAGLIVLLPALAVIALLVRITSVGPVLFRQQRVGRNFRPFFLYKFRTMVADASRLGPTITAAGDPRVTRVGRLLRATKLDELPQLVNVITGDMSLVGPRPEVPEYVEMFRQDYREILQVRPGITDLASIKYRDEAAVLARAADPEREYVTRILPEKIALAKEYVRRASILFDLKLIAYTLVSIVRRTSGAPEVGSHATVSTPGRARLLFVGNFWSTSNGKFSVCEALSSQLRGTGWTVLTTSSAQGRLARLADMVSTVWRRRHDYDVVHVDVFSERAFLLAEAVCATARLVRKPYVLTLHGGALPEFAQRHPHRVRRLLAGAAAVTAPSRYLQERMRAYRADVRLHPNPLDTAQYRFQLRSQPDPTLVWVRAFHDFYNPTLAVRVLARLKRRFPAARLTMIGPDKGDGSLARARGVAQEEGVADAVTFTGSIRPDAVAGYLARHDVFLNTTNVDNAPVSVLEALASGLPTISTNAGGIPFLLEHDDDALLVPVGDLDAMHDAVERIITEPGLAARLSAHARLKAETFDWPRILPLWEQLFRTLNRSEGQLSASRSELASLR